MTDKFGDLEWRDSTQQVTRPLDHLVIDILKILCLHFDNMYEPQTWHSVYLGWGKDPTQPVK